MSAAECALREGRSMAPDPLLRRRGMRLLTGYSGCVCRLASNPCFLVQARLRGHQSDCAHVNDMHIGHDKVNLRCKDPNRCRLDKANTPRLFDMLDSATIL